MAEQQVFLFRFDTALQPSANMHALVHTYSSTLVAEKWHQQRSTKNCSSSSGHLESISRLACVTANRYNRQFWALWLVFHFIGTLQ